MNKTKYFAITFTILALFGCSSHKNEDKGSATTSNSRHEKSNITKNTSKCGEINSDGVIKVCNGITPSEYTIPHGKIPSDITLKTPDSDYKKIDNEAQIMFYYAAYSKKHPSYESMAEAYSGKYNSTTNVFKKKSILENLSPIFSKEIAAAKSHPYVVINGSTDFNRGDYSFSKKRYTIGSGLLAGARVGYSCIQFEGKGDCRYGFGLLKVRNYNNMRHIYVKDESTAKKIADYISKGGVIKYKLYGFVYGAQNNNVEIEAIKVKIYGPKNKLLLTQHETSLLGKAKSVKIFRECIEPYTHAAIMFSISACMTNGNGHLLYQLPDGNLSIHQPKY